MVYVIKSVAPLTQSLPWLAGPFFHADVVDALMPDVVGELTPHTAIGTERINRPLDGF